MQLISKSKKGFKFLLCIIDICSKYAWVIPLKGKKGIAITDAFSKNLDELNRKPNKVWLEKSSEFYKRSIKLWLQKDDFEMYSKHNERKWVIAERFTKTLKNKYII